MLGWHGESKPVVLGSSLGCAVIWAYVELYGDAALGKCVFVDQAPSQWALPDWTLGSKGIYDAASLANIQAALGDMSAFADGNAECCLSIPPSEEVLAVLKAETLKCNSQILGKLMADHAPKDWRAVLKRITVPCLNLYGTKSGCFPEAGCAAVGELIPDCRNQPFDGCNHWLYLEGRPCSTRSWRRLWRWTTANNKQRSTLILYTQNASLLRNWRTRESSLGTQFTPLPSHQRWAAQRGAWAMAAPGGEPAYAAGCCSSSSQSARSRSATCPHCC